MLIPGRTHLKGKVPETEGKPDGFKNPPGGESKEQSQEREEKTTSENGGRQEQRRRRTSRSSPILISTRGETGSSPDGCEQRGNTAALGFTCVTDCSGTNPGKEAGREPLQCLHTGNSGFALHRD